MFTIDSNSHKFRQPFWITPLRVFIVYVNKTVTCVSEIIQQSGKI